MFTKEQVQNFCCLIFRLRAGGRFCCCRIKQKQKDFSEAEKHIKREFQVHEIIKKLRVCFNVLRDTHGEDKFRKLVDKYSLFDLDAKRSTSENRAIMLFEDMHEEASVSAGKEFQTSSVSAMDNNKNEIDLDVNFSKAKSGK